MGVTLPLDFGYAGEERAGGGITPTLALPHQGGGNAKRYCAASAAAAFAASISAAFCSTSFTR